MSDDDLVTALAAAKVLIAKLQRECDEARAERLHWHELAEDRLVMYEQAERERNELRAEAGRLRLTLYGMTQVPCEPVDEDDAAE